MPLLSRITYSYLDKLVYYAWHVPQLALDDLPKLSAKSSASFLRRKAFPVIGFSDLFLTDFKLSAIDQSLDPLLLGRKRHIFWGFLRVYGEPNPAPLRCDFRQSV